MKIKFLSKCLLLSITFIFLMSTVGVYATWNFSQSTPRDTIGTITINMGEFKWAGAEILPDDIKGEDHAWLIRNLVHGEGIGLNTSRSYLNNLIDDRLDGGLGWSRDYFGSMAVTGGNDMEKLFGTEAEGLSFIIYVISDTEYYIFTTSVYLGERGETNWLQTSNKTPGKPSIPLNEYIYAIFRTKVTRPNKNSEWEIIETKKGKALSCWYDESRRNANITQIPSFKPSSWVEATNMGNEATTQNAIWTFIGDDTTAYPTSYENPIYYRITPNTSKTLKIYSYNLNSTIKIYNNSNALLGTSTLSKDANGIDYIVLNYNVSANTLYYISFVGDLSIPFVIK